MRKFSYDDMTPIYALPTHEKEIATALNTKGYTNGLLEEEYAQLKLLYEHGIMLFEKVCDNFQDKINKE